MTIIEALEQMVKDGTVQLSMKGWGTHTMPPIYWGTVETVSAPNSWDVTGIRWLLPYATKFLEADFAKPVTLTELLNYENKAHIPANATSHAALLAYNNLTHERLNAVLCTHSWKHYEGIMDSFDFCEKCDEKKR